MRDKRPIEEQEAEAYHDMEVALGPEIRREFEENDSWWGMAKLVWKYRSRKRLLRARDENRDARRRRFEGKP